MRENFVSLYEQKKSGNDLAFNITTGVLIALMFVMVILNTFVFFIVSVSGSSMEKTLYTGDCLVVNKYKQADYGDIVIVERENKLVIKRVVALGGDSVKIEDGKVYLKKSGEQGYRVLSEDYINGNFTTVELNAESEWVLDSDEIFYLGDNRVGKASYDCRAYGPVKVESVLGVVENWSISIKGFLGKLNKLTLK